jgi:hypothetical protein
MPDQTRLGSVLERHGLRERWAQFLTERERA